MQLPQNVEYILDKLAQNGFEAYVIGGCTRDILMNKQPHDWDITTNALPLQIKEIFDHTVDTGIEHGTVTVVLNKENYEVTTYRIDGEYKDHRKPQQVAFTTSLQEDCARRDFTINAIAYNNNELKDFFGGQKDIQNKIIRCIGNPNDRFNEDALRMLRAVRFSLQLNFTIEEETLNAIKEHAETIKAISRERVRDELVKNLLAQYPQNLQILDEVALLDKIFEKDAKINLQEIGSLLSPKLTLQMALAIFFKDVEYEKVKLILKDLCFDNKTQKEVLEYLQYKNLIEKEYNEGIEQNSYEIRKKLSYITNLENLLKIESITTKNSAIIDIINDMQVQISRIEKAGDATSVKELEINGNDLMQLGYKGIEIKEIQMLLLDEVLREPENNKKEFLMKVAQQNI